MSMKKIVASVVSQKQIGSDVFDMVLNVGDVAAMARPGQFISMYSNDKSKLLPRPISICGINAEEGTLRVVYRAVGEGTKEFSKMVPGQTLDVIGPLGNGVTMKDKKAILFGGGIGIPPMLELAKQLNCDSTAVLGYRDEIFLADEFEKVTKVAIASEDGKTGTKGNVLDAVRELNLDAEIIYACGPMPMLKAIKAWAEEKNIECQVSLEERMACGIGACLACVCKSTEVDHHTHVHNKRICKDGPVFDAKEVVFE